jgi:hypothetical protein
VVPALYVVLRAAFLLFLVIIAIIISTVTVIPTVIIMIVFGSLQARDRRGVSRWLDL